MTQLILHVHFLKDLYMSEQCKYHSYSGSDWDYWHLLMIFLSASTLLAGKYFDLCQDFQSYNLQLKK